MWQCEFEEAPSRVLAERWPGIPNFGDVTKVDWATVEPVDILTGGFPCQDVSLAGRRAGMREGTRSGLWSEMLKAIEVLQPQKVVIENVRGLLSAGADSGMEQCPWCLGDGGGVSMLCGHSVPFLETWPTRGMTRNGKVYELPMSVHRMEDSGSSSSQSGELFRTPTAVEAEGGLVHPEKARAENRTVRLGAQILEMTGDLLPTPVAQPSGNTPENHLRKKPGREQVTDLAIIVENGLLETWGKLLPTPRSADYTHSMTAPSARKHVADGFGALAEVIGVELLPTPNTMDSLPAREGEALMKARMRGDARQKPSTVQNLRERVIDDADKWGKYAPAIRRWEQVLGRESPAPTQLSAKGKAQLSSAFVEWMMGLDPGWVTSLGLTRNQELRMLGNGVVPQQAFEALKRIGRIYER